MQIVSTLSSADCGHYSAPDQRLVSMESLVKLEVGLGVGSTCRDDLTRSLGGLLAHTFFH